MSWVGEYRVQTKTVSRGETFHEAVRWQRRRGLQSRGTRPQRAEGEVRENRKEGPESMEREAAWASGVGTRRWVLVEKRALRIPKSGEINSCTFSMGLTGYTSICTDQGPSSLSHLGRRKSPQ